MTLVGGGRGMALLSQRREKRSPIRVPVVASAISPTGLPTPPLAPGCLFQPQGKALTAPRSPASLKLPFSQMLDGGAEPQSSPTSRAGVGEGEGEGLARGAGGPGQAAGRAGSVVETQRALLLGLHLVLLLTLQGELRVVQMEGDTVSDSPCPCSCLCCAQSLQSCPTLCNPVDCSPPGLSVNGFPRQEYGTGCHSLFWGIFLPSDRTPASCISCIGRWTLYHSATGKVPDAYSFVSFLSQDFQWQALRGRPVRAKPLLVGEPSWLRSSSSETLPLGTKLLCQGRVFFNC